MIPSSGKVYRYYVPECSRSKVGSYFFDIFKIESVDYNREKEAFYVHFYSYVERSTSFWVVGIDYWDKYVKECDEDDIQEIVGEIL